MDMAVIPDHMHLNAIVVVSPDMVLHYLEAKFVEVDCEIVHTHSLVVARVPGLKMEDSNLPFASDPEEFCLQIHSDC